MEKALKVIGIIFIVLTLIFAFNLIIFSTIGNNNSTLAETENMRMSFSSVVEQKNSFIAPKSCAIGDSATLNGIEATLTNAFEVESDFPKKGNVLLAVEFNITNRSDKEITISSMMSFDAYFDEHGCYNNLDASIAVSDYGNQLDGTIKPGRSISGIIGYEIPDDWQEFEIHYKPRTFSDDITFIIERGKYPAFCFL